MKNYSLILAVIILFCTFLSCENDDIITLAPSSIPSDVPSSTLSRPKNNYIDNQLIVRYKRGTTEHEKVLIRERYNIIDFETCNCGDNNELWIFTSKIEERRAQASADPQLDGVDFNFTIQTTPPYFPIPVTNSIPHEKIVNRDNGVNIAMLDTGIDVFYSGFAGNSRFLYNSFASGTNYICGSYQDYYGWDFINKDNIPEDDHGHGTLVTYCITSILEEYAVPYSILPVKIFDERGESTYFNMICGFQYALSKPNINIINISAGWYEYEVTILDDIIEEASETRDVLIVTSAGNNSDDNDLIPHYPSSYPYDNILSITGMNLAMNGLAEYSNYGHGSVDLAAKSEDISFPGVIPPLRGTSFAAAYATANASHTIHTSGIMSFSYIKQQVITNAVPISNRSPTNPRPIRYWKRIPYD